MNPLIDKIQDKARVPEKERQPEPAAALSALPNEPRRAAERFLRGEHDPVPKTRLHKKMQGEF